MSQLEIMGISSPEIKKNKIKSKFHLIDGHYGIDPIITHPDIKTFSIFRNPIDRVVSNFTVLEDLYFTEKETNKEKLYFFESWVRDDNNLLLKSNFQSRFLSKSSSPKNRTITIDQEYLNQLNEKQKTRIEQLMGWGIDQSEIDFNYVEKIFNNLVLIGTTENHYSFMKNLVDMFNTSDKLNLDINKIKNTKFNNSPLSFYINANMTKEAKDILKNLNRLDFVLWEKALLRKS